MANLAAGALVFGQALTGSVPGHMAFGVAAGGVLFWSVLTWGALRVSRLGRRLERVGRVERIGERPRHASKKPV